EPVLVFAPPRDSEEVRLDEVVELGAGLGGVRSRVAEGLAVAGFGLLDVAGEGGVVGDVGGRVTLLGAEEQVGEGAVIAVADESAVHSLLEPVGPAHAAAMRVAGQPAARVAVVDRLISVVEAVVENDRIARPERCAPQEIELLEGVSCSGRRSCTP